jgi:UDPglucose 6-dehydrogenase
MKIGIIGLGMVGKTIYNVLSEYYLISYYDIKIESSRIEDVLDTDIVFIAVPTNLNVENKCDTSIVEETICYLHLLNYTGIICIKSTVTPTTTIKLIEKHGNDKLCFCPEFLRERCAVSDFKADKLCLIGTENIEVFRTIKSCHSDFCSKYKMVHPTEAELTKYFLNVYNTYRVMFANTFYEVCEKTDVNYTNVLNNLVERGHIDGDYLKCNENLRGVSGVCLRKDTIAFSTYIKKLDIPATIIKAVVNDLELYEETVIEE